MYRNAAEAAALIEQFYDLPARFVDLLEHIKKNPDNIADDPAAVSAAIHGRVIKPFPCGARTGVIQQNDHVVDSLLDQLEALADQPRWHLPVLDAIENAYSLREIFEAARRVVEITIEIPEPNRLLRALEEAEKRIRGATPNQEPILRARRFLMEFVISRKVDSN